MEYEIVGVDDVMPMVLRRKYFLGFQVYIIDTYIFNYNHSSMILDKNRRNYSGKRTRHINIRYFFMENRVKYGEINTKYCPTDDMIGGYLTKPLQGSKFIKFREKILNIQ